jgi:hypothetical protein
MNHHVTARLGLALALASVVGSGAAHAQPAAQAEALFRQGRELVAAGKLAEACEAFAGSQKLDPAVTTLLNLADCEEKRGHLASAWGDFVEAGRQTREARDADGQKLHQVATEHAAKLEPRVPKLTIAVSAKSRIEHLEVLRDGAVVDASTWNLPLPIDGGKHQIVARAPGATEWTTQVTIGSDGDVKTVKVPKLAPAAVVETDKQAEKTVLPPPAAPASQAPAIGLGIGAVALLGGAIGFSLWGDSTWDQAKVEPNFTRQDDLWHSANTKRYVAEGMLGASIGCAGLALWLFLRTPHDESPRSTVAVEPVISGDHAGVAFSGTFR